MDNNAFKKKERRKMEEKQNHHFSTAVPVAPRLPGPGCKALFGTVDCHTVSSVLSTLFLVSSL